MDDFMFSIGVATLRGARKDLTNAEIRQILEANKEMFIAIISRRTASIWLELADNNKED